MSIKISTQARDDSIYQTIFVEANSAAQFVRYHGNNGVAIEQLARALDFNCGSAGENAVIGRMRNGSKRALRDCLRSEYIQFV